jgi:hypothetical protein
MMEIEAWVAAGAELLATTAGAVDLGGARNDESRSDRREAA